MVVRQLQGSTPPGVLRLPAVAGAASCEHVAGWLVVAGALGSASGLWLAGTIADVLDSFGGAMAAVCLPAGLVAMLFAVSPRPGARAGAIGARGAASPRRAGGIPPNGKWAPDERPPRIHGSPGLALRRLLPGESDCGTLVLTIAIGGDADAESSLAAPQTDPIGSEGEGVIRTVRRLGTSAGG
jgi:hypothetical protein